MTQAMTFTVLGLPQPAGSKRAFPIRRKNGQIGVAVSDSNPKARDWKNAVASAAYAAQESAEILTGILNGPLEVTMRFYLPRPAGHFGKHGLKPSAPDRPTVRPDTQKLARGTTDALTGIIWRDDSQIVDEHLHKQYGEPARCEITIQPL